MNKTGRRLLFRLPAHLQGENQMKLPLWCYGEVDREIFRIHHVLVITHLETDDFRTGYASSR